MLLSYHCLTGMSDAMVWFLRMFSCLKMFCNTFYFYCIDVTGPLVNNPDSYNGVFAAPSFCFIFSCWIKHLILHFLLFKLYFQLLDQTFDSSVFAFQCNEVSVLLNSLHNFNLSIRILFSSQFGLSFFTASVSYFLNLDFTIFPILHCCSFTTMSMLWSFSVFIFFQLNVSMHSFFFIPSI